MSLLEQLPPTLVASFSRHIKSFGVIGLDFFEDPNLRVRYYFRHVLFVIALLLFFTGQVFYFIKIKEIGVDFTDVSNAVPCLLLTVQDLVKLIVVRKKKYVKRIFLDIAELWPSNVQSEEKQNIMNYWLRRLKMFNDTVFSFTAFGLVGFTGIPFVVSLFSWYGDGADAFYYPFQIFRPFPVTSKWLYCLVYFVDAGTACVTHACLYQACDLLVCTLVIEVCLLMRLLQYDLENLAVLEKDKYGRHDPAKAEECYQAAKQIARTHQKLLRICEKINEFYGGIIFTVVCFSSIILCFFGFLTIVFATVKIQLFKSLLALVETLFIVFCITLPGQILQETSSGIADAAYRSLWYESDLKFRKMIFIIMARSQKPCHLSALGFSVMNFNGLCKICSTAWSYLSLLNQMYRDTDFQM